MSTGESLSLVLPGTAAIAIDPTRSWRLPRRASISFYEQESDDFFRTTDPVDVLEGAVDVAFIDGLHVFEQVLRDFLNVERSAHRDSVVFIHDVLPKSAESAHRSRMSKEWCGDVWKLVSCLSETRPDLRIACIDAPPSGLAVVTQLDPQSTTRATRFDATVEDYASLAFTDYQDHSRRWHMLPADWTVIERWLAPRAFRRVGRRELVLSVVLRGVRDVHLRAVDFGVRLRRRLR